MASKSNPPNASGSRFRELRNEFWTLHANQGISIGEDSIMHAINTRGISVEISKQEKLDLVGFMNLSCTGKTTARYGGSLPLTRLGGTPSVTVLASSNWITGGSYLPKHNPSFKAFCLHRLLEDQNDKINGHVESIGNCERDHKIMVVVVESLQRDMS